jgi:hypothetical protein
MIFPPLRSWQENSKLCNVTSMSATLGSQGQSTRIEGITTSLPYSAEEQQWWVTLKTAESRSSTKLEAKSRSWEPFAQIGLSNITATGRLAGKKKLLTSTYHTIEQIKGNSISSSVALCLDHIELDSFLDSNSKRLYPNTAWLRSREFVHVGCIHIYSATALVHDWKSLNKILRHQKNAMDEIYW